MRGFPEDVLKYFSDFEDGRCNRQSRPFVRYNDRSLEKTLSPYGSPT